METHFFYINHESRINVLKYLSQQTLFEWLVCRNQFVWINGLSMNENSINEIWDLFKDDWCRELQ